MLYKVLRSDAKLLVVPTVFPAYFDEQQEFAPNPRMFNGQEKYQMSEAAAEISARPESLRTALGSAEHGSVLTTVHHIAVRSSAFVPHLIGQSVNFGLFRSTYAV